ncbi:MAG TPA: HAMP domain-containing sensor histidine kinase [Acidimicrobiales bacterium]|nr:HAMP domain-containing sensor histidine kinase [Acidimicrobiales bacterium]
MVSRLRAAAWTMAGIAAVLFSLSRHTAGTLDPDVLALVGASVAATLLFATAWLDVLVWRLTGDPRSVFLAAAALSLAAVPILMGVVVPALTHAALLDHARHSVAIAGIPALVVLTLAARAPAAPAVRSARFVVVAALVVTAGLAVALAAPGARTLAFHDDVSLPLAGPTTSLALAAAFGVVAAVHAGLTRRRTGHLLTWSGIAVTGVGVAYAIEAAGGGTVHVAAWLMTCAAIAVGLYGTSLDLERERVAEQRAARDAVAVASVATARARAVHEVQQEHRHEARAALLGIEAAAECLSRYRRGLSPDEQAELSRGLVAEIRRLRFLVEDTVRRTTTFDLRDAVMPVVCCSRANGLAVSADVPAGLEVEGVPESTAQVVLSLLTNARCHAPGSPVELRAEPGEREVALYVEDRGPGLPPALDEPLFQRSARGPGSRGAGLGLFVARGLMARQRGSIDARPRPGGGCSFVVRLPRPGIAT